MKKLWQRVWELSRQHVVLWLPVVGAALLSYGWMQLRKSAIHQILPGILRAHQGHSVLGGSFPASGDGTAEYGVYVASFLITTACEYADICCYVIAMLIIARLLSKLMTETTHGGSYRGFSVARHGLSGLWLSLFVYLLALASTALMFPLLSSATALHRSSLLKLPFVIAVVYLVMYSALAFFTTPVALRLLARAGGAEIGPQEIAIGRRCSLLAGLAISLFSGIQLSIVEKLHTDHAQSEAFGIVGTIFIALPYVPLFIAFSLISMKDFKLMAPTNDAIEVEQTVLSDGDSALSSADS